MASTEVEHHDTVDTGWVREPADAPSARFGWHGVGMKTSYIAAVFCALALVAMIIGNHHGHIEDIYLIGFAAVLIYFVVRGVVMNRNKWS
ncbi:hypothetical protein Gbro_2115 [Gordonia bronchialis DSM 43247]|uniref:DUF2631 domain-containing protein n=1 Tax=Gordonia bronchialis (strain ATCC 25592 / DSM 43247 / BCRC 13721 / JCM 3198 / KCTC 3076 / NBRC 16047 / NCTC 10667) TaxID=526226 RepID=D0LAQ1_GORB4|nr:DUF2631 domain-containing protein [Gordonia bronchialis]ACY21364.1 hypothetical protein Gbro_2115 [Gordonia bronchialis DSM 43247]MCC3324147.1 DUF2631 domain-containing protein [Gordonia bronchialis]QGS24968.1 DUF2631 domain-containing protein [Gordonia bronchialis]UAK38757.1 DUF2631 domain-containing protein [Gordonia bronchialis]STQ64245.1 Protein of uncharacterised function (DUF2631) [Gordonia bronchialis]